MLRVRVTQTIESLKGRVMAPACRTLPLSRPDLWGIWILDPRRMLFGFAAQQYRIIHLAIKLRTAAFQVVLDRDTRAIVRMHDRPKVPRTRILD